MEEGLGFSPQYEIRNQVEDADASQDYIIDIPNQYKIGRILPPNKLGSFHFFSSRSFEFIVYQIQKVHNAFKPFLWVYSDINTNKFTIISFYTSYNIYIYADIESNMYIIEFINVNMSEEIFSKIYKELVIKII